MQCVIYRSVKQFDSYLYIREKDRFDAVPESLLNLLGRLEFVMELDLSQTRRLARADIRDVVQQLQDKGYFLQMPPTLSPDQVQ